MSDYKVTDSELTIVANAIRIKGGTSASLPWPDGFVSAISDISSGGIIPSGSISISENGTYDVTSFANAVVDVPQEGGSNDNFLIVMDVMSGSIFDTEATIIRDYFLNNVSKINGVEMQNVSFIGSSAFYSCVNLSNASFPKCEVINANAFARCVKLEKLPYKPSVIRYIGDKAFSSMSSQFFEQEISNLSLDVCSHIGSDAFSGLKNLVTAFLPSAKLIKDNSFRGCVQLRMVSAPLCSSIYANVFSGCSQLESVYLLGSSVVTLYNSATFSNTPITNSSYLGYFGSIFVPESLVSEYKSKANWSHFSDRITSYVE